jgi:tetratricopeptide (TPR) repeat protein
VTLQLRMLGSLSVSQGSCALELPASRKVRALLAYLALAPRATPRHRLCSLLWDTASDPRGELRWALTKLRGVVGPTRVAAHDDSLRLDLADSFVDALEIQRAAQAGIGTLTSQRAGELLALFNGDFLEGLEVAGCSAFAGWLHAERQRFQAWRVALLEIAPADIRVHDSEFGAQTEQAYDYYLQGRQHLARMMKRGLQASRRMFMRAIELDEGYGPAWAGLATVHACLYEWFDTGTVGLARAEHASRRALEAAPKLAEAHAARGLARSLSRHYDEAVGEFEAAIRLNSYLFDAYYYYARTAFAVGDMPRAAEMFELAAQLRSEDFQSPMLLGTAARALGRESAAHDAVCTGIRRAEQILALNPHDGRALSLGAGALIDAGQTERALEWSRRCLDLYPDDTSALVNIACVHARAGQSNEALDLLERVFAQGCGKRDWVMHDPDYSSLHPEPRFHRLVSRLR